MTSSAKAAAGKREILFFLCLDDRGGAEISALKLAQGLLSLGRAVVLAVYGSNTTLARELGFTGEVIDLRARRTAAAIWPLYRLLRQGRFRTIIGVLTHANMAAIATACAAGKDIRVIATEHGIDGLAMCEESTLFKFLTRIAYTRAEAIVAVSQGLAQRWRESLPISARVMTIYNPVIPDSPQPMPLPAHEWLAQKKIPTLLGIGRLKAEKNFDLLVRAFAQVAGQRNARLVILGEGDQRPVLERLVHHLNLQDKILLPGFIADPLPWLAHADLFVSASRREGFGNAIVEALGQGVPVIATDCPHGPSEILAKGRYGQLVPMDDAKALALAIDAALDNTVDKQLLKMRAHDFTEARCIDLYQKLIDNQSTS
jgi:glycosyltransferase involved in cell wall biosynthesis